MNLSVRVGAALVMLVLFALIGWTLVDAWQRGDPVVVPTNGVVAGGPQDTLPTGPAASEMLALRTRMQAPRVESGPSPRGGETAAVADGAPMPAEGTHSPVSGDALVAGWLDKRDADFPVLRERGFTAGETALPDPRADVLEQPRGRDFRRLHNEEVPFGGGWLILGVGALLCLVLVLRGRIPLAEGFSGVRVPRFGSLERANHWLTASGFVMLGLSGLILLYGKTLIRPWLGAGAYSWLAGASVYVHIAFMPAFLLGVTTMTVLWLRQNLPGRVDLRWLARGGGFFSNSPDKPPARRFNAGQKLMFWGVVLGTLLMAVTGFTLMFPFFWGGVWTMQLAQLLHAVGALMMVALIVAHIWIGTVGMVGAFDAMWTGTVDRNWAHEHHRLWYEELKARGDVPGAGPRGPARGGRPATPPRYTERRARR